MKELLSPASTYKKAMLAFLNGADAIYIGYGSFSLRKRATEISEDELKKIIDYASKNNKKVYVTANIIPKKEDLKDIKKYFKHLKKMRVDGVIIASTYFAYLAKKIGLNVFISTQASLKNSYAIKYYEALGAKRCILARELNIEDIKKLKSNIELECFIHGGCCMSYSGRCVLSNIMSQRDANRGDCAHSCRWQYTLYKDGKKISPNIFSLSSKDLNTVKYFSNILKLPNIQSYKIEGRMKSENYLLTVTNTYRYLIDNINNLKDEDYEMLEKEIKTSGGRDYQTFNINNDYSNNTQIYDYKITSPKQNFIASVMEYKKDEKRVYITCKNKFYENQEVYFFSKKGKTKNYFVKDLKDEDNIKVDFANHPEAVYSFYLEEKIEKDSLMKTVYNE